MYAGCKSSSKFSKRFYSNGSANYFTDYWKIQLSLFTAVLGFAPRKTNYYAPKDSFMCDKNTHGKKV